MDLQAENKEHARRVQCFVNHYSTYSKPNATEEKSAIEEVLFRHTGVYSKVTAWIKVLEVFYFELLCILSICNWSQYICHHYVAG